jgi:hypothetical protein
MNPGRPLPARSILLLVILAAVTTGVGSQDRPPDSALIQVSGIYPHLAVFNDTGEIQDRECGIGAVVPWAGRLWLMTYPPHRRTGSVDKLYSIDGRLGVTIRPESVGGTHAGRMIHRESQQLVLGPYVIDAQGRVRAFDQSRGFPARITAVARHLTDPANKVYLFDMEGPIWEADVRTLAVSRLFVKPVPGWHGKGAYTGQGRLIIANNGDRRTPDLDDLTWEAPEASWSKGAEDAGALAEWDGRQWTVVSRRSHAEVTGPGGLLGESSPDAPVWSTGWDKRSVLLHVRTNGGWHLYRLAKGSYSYDPSHGWFTEWPRIRSIGDGPLLLNMHGTFFDFPAAFVPGRSAGVRPLGTHLHYTTDFTEWNGRVVLSGDDTSILDNALASRPQSNLRFVTRSQLATEFGPRNGWGGVWIDDRICTWRTTRRPMSVSRSRSIRVGTGAGSHGTRCACRRRGMQASPCPPISRRSGCASRRTVRAARRHICTCGRRAIRMTHQGCSRVSRRLDRTRPGRVVSFAQPDSPAICSSSPAPSTPGETPDPRRTTKSTSACDSRESMRLTR